MDLLNFSLTQFDNFIIVFIRTAAMLFATPIFRSVVIPFRVRLSFVVVLSFFILSLIKSPLMSPAQISNPLALIPIIFTEIILGLLIGLTIQCIFAGIETGAELISIQIGLGMARILDPLSGAQVSVIGQFYSLFALIVFFSLNIHHVVIKMVVESFSIISFNQIRLNPSLMKIIITLTNEIFVLAIKISIPIIVFIFLTNLSMAIIGRMIPQMNIMMVGTPVLSALGFLIIGISLPFFLFLLKRSFGTVEVQMWRILQNAGG